MSSYSSFNPSPFERNPAQGLSRRPEHQQHSGDVGRVIQPLYEELNLITRQLHDIERSEMAHRDDGLVAALGQLDSALHRFVTDVDWEALRRSRPVMRRAEQILLAPVDLSLLDQVGSVLQVEPEARALMKRDFEAAIAQLNLSTEPGAAAPLDVLHEHLTQLSFEVAQVHREARAATVGNRQSTPEQRRAWRKLIDRVGRILVVFALLLGVANDSYALDDLAHTGIGLWRQFAEIPPTLGHDTTG